MESHNIPISIKECGNTHINNSPLIEGEIINFEGNLNPNLSDNAARLNSLLANNSSNHLLEEVKTKKTNSTGDTTPNRSLSMTSDMIDQLFLNENYFGTSTHLHDNINNIQSEITQVNASLNKLKINEYKNREKEALGLNNKVNLHKKPFNDMASNLTNIVENIEKYFALPRKVKGNEQVSKKLIIKKKKI